MLVIVHVDHLMFQVVLKFPMQDYLMVMMTSYANGDPLFCLNSNKKKSSINCINNISRLPFVLLTKRNKKFLII